MIPSFHPVRRYLEIAARAREEKTRSPAQKDILHRAVQPRNIDPESGLEIKTLSELLESSKKVRYPDMPFVSYPDMLANELNNSALTPFTNTGGKFWTDVSKPRIAVIGGGMSGLLTAWQLRKLGASVDLFDASAEPNGSAASPQGAGRIRTVNVANTPDARAELGAMRFPDTSYLFWHYLRLSGVDDTTNFVEFPNPGKVPTYLSGDKSLSAYWGPGGIPDLYDGSREQLGGHGDVNFAALQERHIRAFMKIEFSGTTLEKVTEIMIGGNSTPGDLETVRLFWDQVASNYYSTSYRDFLVGNGFSSEEINVIGFLGVGTGGFAALFDTSVMDVMRLFVWNYAAEYAVPELYKYPFGLLNKLKALIQTPDDGSINYNKTVQSVSYHPEEKKYTIAANGIQENHYYDYVVCAMTHKAAYKLLSEAKPSGPNIVMPYSRVQYTSATSLFRDDIQYQQGMSSVKIFQTIIGPTANISGLPPFSSVVPRNNVNYGKFTRVIFGATDPANPLGVTYMLPHLNQNFSQSRQILSLHYSWGQDSNTISDGLLAGSSEVNNALNDNGVFFGLSTSLGSHITDAVRNRLQVYATGEFKYEAPNVLNGASHWQYYDNHMRPNFAIVDWDRVPYVNMGFKLDAPSRGQRSINHFRLVAQTEGTELLTSPTPAWDNENALDHSVKGLYFCGDSFSYYGGWVEGAFQSALNVTAGIVYAEAISEGMDKLSAYAIQLVTGVKPSREESTES